MPDPAQGRVSDSAVVPGATVPGTVAVNNNDGARPPAVVVPPLPARWKSVGAALAGGSLAAILGTALHAHVWFVSGLGVPAGAFAAVALTVSVSTFIGLWARNLFMTALTGAAAYAVVGLIATVGAGSLIAAGVEIEGATPAVSVAGYVWVVGIAVGTIVSVAVTWAVLRQSAAIRKRDRLN